MRLHEFTDPRENPRFRAWFGASKVVDAEGRPLVCYHGTRAGLDLRSFAADHSSPTTMGRSPGHYFTADPKVANNYADNGAAGGQVIPVYLRIVNPLRLQRYTNTEDLVKLLGPEVEALNDVLSKTYGSYFRDVGRGQTYFFFKDEWGDHLMALAEDRGYDGVIFPETKTGRDAYDDTYVAFRPNQIKSVFSVGFDPRRDGISEGGVAGGN